MFANFTPDLGSHITAERSPEDAVCASDESIRSLRARFRAVVTTSDAKRSAEGVLVMQRPGALRVKLFTLAGFTVYDAIWHMRSRGIRRLPVVDAKCRLLGVLTADDLSRFLAEELTEIARVVPHQIKREAVVRAATVVPRRSP